MTEQQPDPPREQPTGSEWNWPGARWWRVDLHAHSPASHDFGSETDRADPEYELIDDSELRLIIRAAHPAEQ